MIQFYQNIKLNASKINSKLNSNAHIQKIYSSAYSVDFRVRIPQENLHVIIGRGKLFEGILLKEKGIPAHLRQKDVFLEFLRSKIVNQRLLKVKVDTNDRCFSLVFGSEEKPSQILFFYFHSKLYFVLREFDFKKNKYVTFKSWDSLNKILADEDQGFAYFDEVGRKDLTDKTIKSEYSDPFELEEMLVKKQIKKDSQKKSKLVKNIKNDLKSLNAFLEIEEHINSESFITSMKKNSKFNGVKIKFTSDEFYKRRNEIFIKLKKVKKGIEIQTQRLKRVEEELGSEKENIVLPRMQKPFWTVAKDNSSAGKQPTAKGYVEFVYSKYKVAYGKNAKGNDEIRNKWGKKEDTWFHLENVTSPHIILKSDQVITMVELEIIASLYGHILNTEQDYFDILYTKVKNLKSVKGEPGKVLYRHEKNVRVNVSTEIKSIIAGILGNSSSS